MFGIVTATVCVPFFLLVGSLNSRRGMQFWRNVLKTAFKRIGASFAWLFGRGNKDEQEADDEEELKPGTNVPKMQRSGSAEAGMRMRLRRWSTNARLAEVDDEKQMKARRLSTVAIPGPQQQEDDLRADQKPNVALGSTRLAELIRQESRRDHLSYSPEV